ncbi:MAG: hypothetical protein LBQ06_00200 [Frankiaceae bacterium]|nr:hypothetical protein [Frankiaceae bacterium]
MADTETETDEEAAAYAEEENHRIRSVRELGDKLDALADRFEKFLAGGGQARAHQTHDSPGPPDRTLPRQEQEAGLRAEVDKALADLKRQEQAEAREKAIDDRLSRVEERTAEKPPRALRRVESIMGWHRDG